jgi:predicted lipopolysaccharide heptosyltransferase III
VTAEAGRLLAGARSVLLVRLRSIGDTVLMTPLLAALRRGLPATEVAVLLDAPLAPLLAGHPDVDRLLPAGRSARGRLGALAAVRAARFDAVVDLHGGPTAALLTRFSRAGLRIGLEGYRRRRAYDRLLPSPFKGSGRAVTLHTVESNLTIAAALGLDRPERDAPRLVTSAPAEAEAEAALAAAGLDLARPFLVLHPGAALRSKTWPAERFQEVARQLTLGGVQVALVAPPEGLSGRGWASSGARPLRPLGLAALAAVLARARTFVGNDSGPAHMAAALGAKVVAVFGSQDPRVWRPWGDGHRALSLGLDCSPCPGRTCANPRRFACLDGIPVEQVVRAAREAIHGA